MLTPAFLRPSDPRWKSGRDRVVFRVRRWSKPAASGCPFPRAASLPRAEEWTGCPGSWRQRVKRSDSDSSPPSLVGLRRGGRKMLEHFVHAFVEVLGVLVRLVGERIARGASPDQFLRLCVEEIDD